MKDLLPKSYLGWIHTTGIVLLIGLIMYNLITGHSPFQQFGFDRFWTTLATGLITLILIIAPTIYRWIKDRQKTA